MYIYIYIYIYIYKIYICIYDNLLSNHSPSLNLFRVYHLFDN